MFYKNDKVGYHEAMPGVWLKTLVYGEKTLMCEFKLKKGDALPAHKHPYEQTGYLVSGRIQLRIDEDHFDVEPGDSWCVPVDVEHAAEVFEDSLAVEIFSPVREEYLKYLP